MNTPYIQSVLQDFKAHLQFEDGLFVYIFYASVLIPESFL
jgi:hypothetical protein